LQSFKVYFSGATLSDFFSQISDICYILRLTLNYVLRFLS